LPFLPLLIVCAGLAHGQEIASGMDALLGAPQVTHAQAGSLVLAAAAEFPDYSGNGTAFKTALDNRWFPRGTEPDTPVTLGELSYLIMKSFNLKGSLWYAIIPSRRFATRYLAYHKVIQGAKDPGLKVSGERFLQILNRSIRYAEDTGVNQ
jgi:hypothetical protein